MSNQNLALTELKPSNSSVLSLNDFSFSNQADFRRLFFKISLGLVCASGIYVLSKNQSFQRKIIQPILVFFKNSWILMHGKLCYVSLEKKKEEDATKQSNLSDDKEKQEINQIDQGNQDNQNDDNNKKTQDYLDEENFGLEDFFKEEENDSFVQRLKEDLRSRERRELIEKMESSNLILIQEMNERLDKIAEGMKENRLESEKIIYDLKKLRVDFKELRVFQNKVSKIADLKKEIRLLHEKLKPLYKGKDFESKNDEQQENRNKMFGLILEYYKAFEALEIKKIKHHNINVQISWRNDWIEENNEILKKLDDPEVNLENQKENNETNKEEIQKKNEEYKKEILSFEKQSEIMLEEIEVLQKTFDEINQRSDIELEELRKKNIEIQENIAIKVFDEEIEKINKEIEQKYKEMDEIIDSFERDRDKEEVSDKDENETSLINVDEIREDENINQKLT